VTAARNPRGEVLASRLASPPRLFKKSCEALLIGIWNLECRI
jgi:hypothetical protein